MLSDVQPQVHFIEIRMERHRGESEEFGSQEAETDQADEGASFELIEFRAPRQVALQKARVDLVVQHYEGAPLSRQENALAAARRETGWQHSWMADHQPSTKANTSGATIVASDSIMNRGVSAPSFPHVIFSFGTAPEYEP